MSDDPLFNDDDIYADDFPPVIHQPIETRIGRITYDPNAVYIDRALLVRMAEHLDAMRLLDICDIETVKCNREYVAECKRLLGRMLGEHGE